MVSARASARAVALRVGLLELLIVLMGLVFVRKEVYLSGHFNAMLLHWQEYVLLVLMFADGVLRGFGEVQGKGQYLSPFRKRFLRYLLPFTLFLFVSCASLCDKVNFACIKQEWWRDIGLIILASGVFLSAWEQRSRPRELETGMAALAIEGASELEHGIVGGGDAMGPGSRTASGSSQAPDSETPGDPGSPGRLHLNEIQVEGPWKLIRYPDRSSMLLELIGLSMTLSAWMPLGTLPGLVVAFKWELADLEAFRISQFGEKYIAYKKKTWFLIPFVY